jgi:hypothetical protein
MSGFQDGHDWSTVSQSSLRDAASAPYGLTDAGFTPKPYGRLVAEGLALARELFGPSVDLAKGSVIRKLLELSALEDARTWATLARTYDDSFVATARGPALSALGQELGLPRPFLESTGTIQLQIGNLPEGQESIEIPAGARLLTRGGHHVALAEAVPLSTARPQARVAVRAFWPGPEHDLDPALDNQVIALWNPLDPKLQSLHLAAAEGAALETVVTILHDSPLSGGDRLWDDERYRRLLLGAPRSIWTQDAIRTAISLVPGVRAVLVRDTFGGLDIERAIFGDMNFLERVFSPQRDFTSSFGFSILVAPTEAAVWEGDDGLAANILQAVEDLRPIGVVPELVRAREIGVGVSAGIIVKGLPLAAGGRETVDASKAASELKDRLLTRLERHVENLGFGEPVRAAQIAAAFLDEPGVEDVRDFRLVRTPATDPAGADAGGAELLAMGTNLQLRADEIAVPVADARYLTVA